MKTAIVNLATIVNGEWRNSITKGDSIFMADGKIVEVGTVSSEALKACDVVIDADGAVAIPGLIDSQLQHHGGLRRGFDHYHARCGWPGGIFGSLRD